MTRHVVMFSGGIGSWATAKQELREHLGKDVAILSEDVRGKPIPLTLGRFRERIESQPALFDDIDFGGCGCFTDDAA